MIKNQDVLVELQKLLSWKKSKSFYAEKLNVSLEEIDDLLEELKQKKQVGVEAEIAVYISGLEDLVVNFKEDVSKGTGELVYKGKDEIKNLEDLILKCNINTDIWNITKYVQNYWGNVEKPYYQVKAFLSKKKEEQLFQESFIDFLKTYSPENPKVVMPSPSFLNKKAMLVINKQDSHLNKFDIDGDNSIISRFLDIYIKINNTLDQASLMNELETVTYIVGSDEFNSEFTETTTKGTPQKNIDTYQNSFEYICNHEVSIISLLLKKSQQVEVIYVPGNHDEYVGWHMIHWLKTYFRNEDRITVDISPSYRKYVSYGKSAMMFNHGDAIKPEKLASIFPIEYREKWSLSENFYIFTGDKHHEVSKDINGIKFYQIPAFSNAKSLWDSKHGHVCSKGEFTAFLIDKEDGMTNIFKQYL